MFSKMISRIAQWCGERIHVGATQAGRSKRSATAPSIWFSHSGEGAIRCGQCALRVDGSRQDGTRKYLRTSGPALLLAYAFTEHGTIMAATVLNSPRAIEMSLYVVRAFVHLRELLSTNKELAQKLSELERKVSTHDQTIVGILKAIRELMNPPTSSKRSIGFVELQERKK